MANKDIQVRRDNKPSGMFDVMPEFENLLDRFFEPGFSPLFRDWAPMAPQVMTSTRETDKYYALNMEIPGIPQEDVSIEVNGNMLTVRAQHSEDKKSSGSDRSRRRQYRSIQQSFSLPTTVDAEQIEAHVENGLLEIILPKTAQAQPRKIQVQSGRSQLSSSENEKDVQTKQDAKH